MPRMFGYVIVIPFAVLCCALVILVSFEYSRNAFIAPSTLFPLHRPWSSEHEDHLLPPWKDINPSRRLKYTPCYGSYQCARLRVPMDWNNASDTDSVALAIIKMPAVVPITDTRYGGAIITMPGGPAGSGVHRLREFGVRYREIIDSPRPQEQGEDAYQNIASKYFDIIAFDPRGVANTTPAFSCFTDPSSRQRWTTEDKRLDLVGTSEVAFRNAWSRAEALAASCTQPGRSKIAYFMNTTPQVADLVALIERIGEWRESTLRSLLQSKAQRQLSTEDTVSPLERLKWRRGQERLQFWGFSYSTVLGAAFASMHPEKVGRMILDGVCDPRGTYGGIGLDNIIDSDEVFTAFFEECHRVGSKYCPSAYIAERPGTIQSTVISVLQKLIDRPLAVPATSTRGPDIITFSDIKRVVKNALYEPIESFPKLAELISDVVEGNGSFFADFKANETARVHTDPGRLPYGELILEALSSMLCTDIQDFSTHKKQEFRDYLDQLEKQGYWMADIWSAFSMPCWHWKARPMWQFSGTWKADPAHPILWIGNTRDPATPLRNAHNMAANYDGSRVLTYDNAGHCSVSAKSKCMTEHIRRYFADGSLPEAGARCSADERPFGGH